MPRVLFARVGLEAEVPIGASVLEAARAAGAPEGTHCGGVCACSKCHVYITAGSEKLSPMADDERDMLDLAANQADGRSRLGCQAHVLAEGQVSVEISQESFDAYLDDAAPAERARVLALWRR